MTVKRHAYEKRGITKTTSFTLAIHDHVLRKLPSGPDVHSRNAVLDYSEPNHCRKFSMFKSPLLGFSDHCCPVVLNMQIALQVQRKRRKGKKFN